MPGTVQSAGIIEINKQKALSLWNSHAYGSTQAKQIFNYIGTSDGDRLSGERVSERQ